ncbi:MAG: DUF354 domain-containing protein [Ignavibacteria bacterium]|nr:DUF354 domain-containing protein [Ignavibacteria bacterium]
MKQLWFDFTNPPHVNQFLPLIKDLSKDNSIFCSARHFVETTELLTKYGIDYQTFGNHGGKNKFKKVYQMLMRNIKLGFSIPKFDLSISSNYEAPFISWISGKKSIVFDDNDISPNWLYAPFATKVFSPRFINVEKMKKYGISNKKLFLYDGFKENIYLADFSPDPDFLDGIPFKEFVTVRPENIFASYVKGKETIVPGLVNRLIDSGYNILYLPRYDLDKSYVPDSDKVFIPPKPLSGLDVCYYSTAVLTGAGTFSREAALLGTPAVSFFAGDEFLNVDKVMFEEGKVFFSRSVDEIMRYLNTSRKKDFNNAASLQVKETVLNEIRSLI